MRAKMEEVFAECLKTHDSANKEYAGEEDALRNFRQDEEIGVRIEQSWGVLASKHWRGIKSWIKGFRSQRENVRGRIKDMIVYLVLLWAIVDEIEEPKPNAN